MTNSSLFLSTLNVLGILGGTKRMKEQHAHVLENWGDGIRDTGGGGTGGKRFGGKEIAMS